MGYGMKHTEKWWEQGKTKYDIGTALGEHSSGCPQWSPKDSQLFLVVSLFKMANGILIDRSHAETMITAN